MNKYLTSLVKCDFRKYVVLLYCIILMVMVLQFIKILNIPHQKRDSFSINSYGDNEVIQNYETIKFTNAANNSTDSAVIARIHKQVIEQTFDNRVIRTNDTIMFKKAANNSIMVAVTACGEQVIEQTLVMMKSAVIFASSFIHFIIMADDIKDILCEQIISWPEHVLNRISFEIRSTSYPNVTNEKLWREAFSPCSSQRLFYAILLTQYDAVLHIDSDALFLSPIDELWQILRTMNGTQIAALATEDMNVNTNWYLNNNVAPFATKFAVNSGIMPMNLTRMRQFNFFSKLEPIVDKYDDMLPWFDQDVLNVYFNRLPQQLYELSCRWNFLTDHCKSGPLCESANKHGIALLHGSRYSFHNSVQPVFRSIYLAFKNYTFGTDLRQNLLIPIKESLKNFQDTYCGKASKIFTQTIEQFLENALIKQQFIIC